MKVLNIWGGPGTGKSTTAAGVFYQMKCQGIKVELVQEYAKDMVWEQRHNILEDQIYIFAKQQRRISRLKQHDLDYVITDSPIAMGLCYTDPKLLTPDFNRLVMHVFTSYDNVNVFLQREVPYEAVGRMQTETQAQELDDKILRLLTEHDVPYQRIRPGDVDAILEILKTSSYNN